MSEAEARTEHEQPQTVGDLDPEREVVKFSSMVQRVHLPEHVGECNSLPAPSYARWSNAAMHFNDTQICELCQRAERRQRDRNRGVVDVD